MDYDQVEFTVELPDEASAMSVRDAFAELYKPIGLQQVMVFTTVIDVPIHECIANFFTMIGEDALADAFDAFVEIALQYGGKDVSWAPIED